ncbi:cell surface protein [Delftia acidovorans]|uniref:Cell surface protein n=1 Tax=Delftia acidovorans TaxID=80866 RepID=A0A7T2RYV1_DELAC|nr:cell surface protein [Delftia acidovorans]QPS05881.1 cell surface protein [Delftia acidovorans]
MKKNVLALSIAAMVGGLGFAGAASASVVVGTAAADFTNTTVGNRNIGTTDATKFVVTEGGTGHNLVVPYFNAQNGNMSVLHLVNTDTNNGKAVKVRFRGAANSDDLLDFQVLLSPQDVWTAAVAQGPDGRLQLTTFDNTCTLPALRSRPVALDESFSDVPARTTPGTAGYFNSTTGRLNPKLSAEAAANGTREGYVEIFNMADIPKKNSPVFATALGDDTKLYKTIKHNASGVAACDTTVLRDTLLNGEIDTIPKVVTAGMTVPTTGLLADWYIMNVPQTTTFSGPATALTAVKTVAGADVAANGAFVMFQQKSTSAAAGGVDVDASTADPLFLDPAKGQVAYSKDASGALGTAPAEILIPANLNDLPDMSTPYLVTGTTPAAQAQALTRAVATTAVINQYANDVSISGKTDWVFSMPTRRYSVALAYNNDPAAAAQTVFTTGIKGIGAAATGEFFHTANAKVEPTTAKGDARICVDATGLATYGREEEEKSADFDLSPAPTAKTSFCGETSVLKFGVAQSDVSVLGASVAFQGIKNPVSKRGWANINTGNNKNGLPILGSAFIKLTNPSAGAGFSGTYGITWPHRYVRPVAP